MKKKYQAPKTVDDVASLFAQINSHQVKQYDSSDKKQFIIRQQGQV